jgi:hypothetical protein
MLRPTVSRQVYLGVKQPSGAQDQVFITDERTGLSFTIAAGPCQHSHSRVPVGLMTIFYCLRFKTPQTWRTRSPYLCPPGTGWPSYTPKALGSLFVASYDSQGYGEIIQTRLHAATASSLYSLDTARAQNAAFNSSYIVACLSIASIT